MKVYRIERARYVAEALKGIGASKSKGFRWNSFNTSMVYTAESRALALLEIAVHLDLSEDLPNDRVVLSIEIPDDLPILWLDEKKLPKNWNIHPPTNITQQIGDQFVLQSKAAVLKVPSSIVSDEFNYLINPNHPDIKKIKIKEKKALAMDKRIFAR
jgi:RES domain-containing protein